MSFSFEWTDQQWADAYNNAFSTAANSGGAIQVSADVFARNMAKSQYLSGQASAYRTYVLAGPDYDSERQAAESAYMVANPMAEGSTDGDGYLANVQAAVDKQMFTPPKETQDNGLTAGKTALDTAGGAIAPTNKVTPTPSASNAQRPNTAANAGQNVFFGDVLVLLEGVQVPAAAVTMAYGLNNLPSCSIVMPASAVIRDLTEDTRVHVFVRDFIDDKMKLLFDGELASVSYSTNAAGASMQISAIHSCAFMSLMQLTQVDVKDYWQNKTSKISGVATIPTLNNWGRSETTVISEMMKSNAASGLFKSMADVVAMLLRCCVNETSKSAVTKFYNKRIGNVPGGWKILNRFFGVNPAVLSSKLPGTLSDPGGNSKGSSDTSTSYDSSNKYSSERSNEPSNWAGHGYSWTNKPVNVLDTNKAYSLNGVNFTVQANTDWDGIEDVQKNTTAAVMKEFADKHPGVEIYVTDGLRGGDEDETTQYGQAGMARNSWHKVGLATDVSVGDQYRGDLQAIANKYFNEVIIYGPGDNHVHMGNPIKK